MSGILNWISALHAPGEIVEIRSVEPKPTISGYFKAGSPNIEAELARYPERTFYQTLNPVKEGCYARDQHERLVRQPKVTSNDHDVLEYHWVLIDCDPERPTGISSTDVEKQHARRVAANIRKYLKQVGFADPIVADSGNGYHLLYRIQASIDREDMIKRFLATLDSWFGNEQVKIDQAVFNPSRITKLYGTIAHKGADTPERPHRPSQILLIPSPLEITPIALFEKVAGETVTQQAATFQQSNGPFDVEAFLTQHGVQIHSRISRGGAMKYVLAECPFDPSHKAPDSAVFVQADGSIGFKCFHNSCADHGWHDVRAKLDPDAYTNTPFMPNKYTSFPQLAPAMEPPLATLPKSTVLDIADIPPYDRSKIQVIRSRFATLDAKIGGFNKGELSIWSGGNASGKSTLVSQLGLEAVHQGYRVALFSGEMTADRVKYWLYLQAAGRNQVEQTPGDALHYQLKPGVEEQLNELLRGKIGIYNNDFGCDWDTVTKSLFSWVTGNTADMIIIDNLMALNLPGSVGDKYDIQTRIVKDLAVAAKQLNVHIHFICHPRKAVGFLRKDDISGTADISNAADNVFMVHRVNADFLSKVKQFYPRLQIPAGVGNAVEILKNRDMGVCDEMILMYFDKTCKTMTDVRGGLPMHGWADAIVVNPEDDRDNPFREE